MKSFYTQFGLAAMVVAISCLALVSPATAADGLDRELEQYWATERDMDVLQDRLFYRDNRWSAGLYTGLHSSDPFFYYYPVGLRVGYNFTNLGVEVGGAFMDASFLTHDTELTTFLRNRLQAAFDSTTDTQDRYLWRANAVATWSPFYGKIALLQRKLAHFELNVAGGLGVVQVERPNLRRDAAFTHTTMEGVFGAGAHFYVNNSIVIRLDGRGYLYRGAEIPTNEGQFFQQLKFPVEFLVGASYLF